VFHAAAGSPTNSRGRRELPGERTGADARDRTADLLITNYHRSATRNDQDHLRTTTSRDFGSELLLLVVPGTGRTGSKVVASRRSIRMARNRVGV
jgi:hypothetical protein